MLTPTLILDDKTMGISAAAFLIATSCSSVNPVVPITIAILCSRQNAKCSITPIGNVKSISTLKSEFDMLLVTTTSLFATLLPNCSPARAVATIRSISADCMTSVTTACPILPFTPGTATLIKTSFPQKRPARFSTMILLAGYVCPALQRDYH